jgi:hypothetical protein
LATRAVTDSRTIQELANTVHQFKYISENGINLEKKELSGLFSDCTSEIRRLYASSQVSKKEVEQILKDHHVPLAHGIREKAAELFLQEASDYRATSRQKVAGSPSSNSGDSDVIKKQGIWGRVKGFFSRK